MIYFWLVNNKILILQVFEDIHLDEKPTLKEILQIFDRIFTAVFVAEMLMKWAGLGLKKYFSNGWCLLDFGIVVVSCFVVEYVCS